jgi:oligoendopeptidase F
MGHAVHAERSKQQPVLYEGFSTTTAETASTLFEQLVQQKLFEQLNEREQYIFLHDKISRDIATIQRQIACFNFELEMHRHIRREGIATKEELAKMMTKHLKSYLGPAVNVTEQDGYSFVYWPHIRYGFYVYTYTYGILMSNLMARRYEADKSFVSEIDTFLSAGGSDTVENIFKSIGIRADKVDTFLESLKNQEEDIALFAKLSKKFAKSV